MRNLGIVAVARPDHGGQFQYTLAMINALCLLPAWHKTIYCPPGCRDAYSRFGLEMRDLPFSRPRALVLALLRGFGLRRWNAFDGEDAVIAPMYAPQLMHMRTPFCYTLHDLQEYYFPQYFSLYQRMWRAFLHRCLSRDARRIICESNFVKADIVKYLDVPAEKIVVMPAPPLWEGTDAPDVATVASVREKYGIPEKYVFYPAQFWPHKNHARLVEAFARIAMEFPDLHLVFTGHSRFEFGAVMQKVESLGLSRRVHHIGYVDEDDILALYKGATAIVIPSLFESISIPVYEAFRVATPVCASGIRGLVDQIGDAGLTFDPLSVDSIAQTMRRLLADEKLRNTLVTHGREKLSAMTVRHYARQLGQLLSSIENT